jgi:LPXTG-motif cell wall-anchored protein/uncharacterized repeat protein (TIGR02543 family)
MKISRILSATGVALMVAASSNFALSQANAVNLDAVSVYLDAPFVQGSYVAEAAGAGTGFTNFNNTSGLGNCGQSLPAGVTLTGTCRVDNVSVYGGASASTDDATPTVGGAGSAYATTVNNTDAITISLPSQSRYLGFWWSAGSPSNTVQFLNDDTVLLTMTTSDIIALLGTGPASNTVWDSKNNSDPANILTAVDANSYRKMWYFGNPRGYSANPPTASSPITRSEPFVYVHMFADGALTFNKIKLSGAGFEFDNLALSEQAQTPAQTLVQVNKIYANHTVKFDANGADAGISMADQVASAAENLTTNAFTREGYTFQGWNTQADGKGTAYADAASFDFDANITLYAVWLQDAPVEPEEPEITPEAPAENEKTLALADTGAGYNTLVMLAFGLILSGLAMVFFVKRRKSSN